jgi:hypothetical protein
MTEFQRLQHLVRLLADMTEEQRRALADFLNSSDGLPQKMLAIRRPRMADRPMTPDTSKVPFGRHGATSRLV